MKNLLVVASATLATLCCVYFFQLNDQVVSSAVSDPPPLNAFTSAADAMAAEAPEGKPLPVIGNTASDLKTTRTFRSFDADNPGIVYGKRGTGLRFAPGSFVDESGNKVNGRVTISIEECYDLTEMLAAKLSTTSDEKMLETAGMVNINATSRGSRVYLEEGSSYEILFPRNGNDRQDFKLFYGEWNVDGIINWRLAESQDQNETDEGRITETRLAPVDRKNDEPCFIQICESYLRRGTRISEMDYFNWQLANGQNLNQWFVSGFNPDLKMVEEYCAEGLRTQITFKVDRNGNFDSYYISNTSTITGYDRALAAFLMNMPALNLKQLMPVYTDDHACILTFGSRATSAEDDFARSFRKKHAYALKDNLKNVDSAELDYFVFTGSQLGWINCDRFVEEEGLLVDYEVNGPGLSDCAVSMVFEDMNSVLKGVNEGDKVVFRGVPLSRKVRIVGIDNPNGNPVMCVVQSNTSLKKTDLRDFKPFSIPDLEGQFAAR